MLLCLALQVQADDAASDCLLGIQCCESNARARGSADEVLIAAGKGNLSHNSIAEQHTVLNSAKMTALLPTCFL